LLLAPLVAFPPVSVCLVFLAQVSAVLPTRLVRVVCDRTPSHHLAFFIFSAVRFVFLSHEYKACHRSSLESVLGLFDLFFVLVCPDFSCEFFSARTFVPPVLRLISASVGWDFLFFVPVSWSPFLAWDLVALKGLL
jgi:hypothetical protein